jgi:phosphoglycerol transferase MdoB-like AlkP superfamily enzyme
MFSLASYFWDLGYATDAFHANKAQNWNRNRVYPFLWFDACHSIEAYPSFTEQTSLHKLPADIADYLYMESVSEAYAGQKRFLFGVTMQNHSGYERFEEVEEDGTVKEYGADIAQDGRVYLSLVRASDKAVQQLVETYRDSDEPTMIVFFGDHQPGLHMDAILGIYTQAQYHLDSYKTKFFIWTNYETEAVENESISANYLPWLILERGNFPLPPYIQMLKEVHEKYPVISSQGVIDAEGNVYDGVSELLEDPLIRKYRYVHYANVFDELDPAWFQTH